MDIQLTIRLFGPMLVLVGNTPLPKMRSRKALWLLALLSTRPNRPVAREWVACTLWPDVDLATAYANLRPVLSELRQALGEFGERIRSLDRNTISLDLTAIDHDVAQFDVAIQEEDFARAVELYGGSFLEGCNDEWVSQERISRELECLRALQYLGEQAIEDKDYDLAIVHFSRAVSLDAWRDLPRRGLMRAFAEKGDVNAALHTYRKFANFLSDRAAVEPDTVTRDLYRHLRAHAKSGGPNLSRNSRSDAQLNYLLCPLCGLNSKELNTQMSSSFKRTSENQLALEIIYCFDNYRFIPDRQLLFRNGEKVHVGSRALDLLHLLVQRTGELIGKDELIRYGWPDTFVHENNLMVNIGALRRALVQSAGLPYIITVPGRGYRFLAPVRVETRSMFEGSIARALPSSSESSTSLRFATKD